VEEEEEEDDEYGGGSEDASSEQNSTGQSTASPTGARRGQEEESRGRKVCRSISTRSPATRTRTISTRFVVAHVIFQRRNPRPTRACRPPRPPWATREGRAREGRATGSGRGRAAGCGAGLGLWGPGDACPPRHATTAAAAIVAQPGTR